MTDSSDLLIPRFLLPSTSGRPLGPGEFKQRRNLVIAFLHQAQCPRCQEVLKALAERYAGLRAYDAEVLAIISGEEQAARELHEQLQLPFPVLFDPKDRAASLCLGTEMRRPALLVVDRYGALWARLVPEEEDGIVEVQQAESWLAFIAVQCPECGVPEQPPPSQLEALKGSDEPSEHSQ